MVAGRATIYLILLVKFSSKQKLPTNPQVSERAFRIISLCMPVNAIRRACDRTLTSVDPECQLHYYLLRPAVPHCLVMQLSISIPKLQLIGHWPVAQSLPRGEE
jgi:hypothetical protein